MIEASCDVTTCDVLLNWLLLCCCRSTENGQSPPARSPKKVSHDHDLELSLLQLYIIQSCVVVNVTFCFNNMTAISQKPCPAQTHSSFVVSSSVLEAVFPKGIVPYARTQLLLGVVFFRGNVRQQRQRGTAGRRGWEEDGFSEIVLTQYSSLKAGCLLSVVIL